MTILFTDGDWRLISSTGMHGTPDLTDIQHRCRQEMTNYLPQEWWYYCGYLQCGVCKEPIPDKMKGLKSLQDWDR